jgi:ribosomal protein S27AE
MSFKDKPLKKIVSDKRVTIDAIHQGITRDFTKEKEIYKSDNIRLCKMENKYLKTPSPALAVDIEKLKSKLSTYDPKESVDYYLNTGMLLSEYYSKKEEENVNTEITVLDFMNKKRKEEPVNDLINEYMKVVDDGVISTNVNYNIDNCPLCSQSLTLKNVDSLLICGDCGYTDNIIINSEKVSYKDPPRESSYFAYKRINHFNEWLAQFQAKETTDIPEGVYNGIMKELDKNKFLDVTEISYKNMREILKKLKYNKYYEHIPHIINILNGKKAPILTRRYEEQLRMMFKDIQTPFMKHCPENRKNFLSYSYVLHKFCQLLELDELLIYFPLLKSREKLQQQDKIWEQICISLRWQYIPSI